MTIIVCLDDNNGMLFAGRRQSRDRVLCARVLEHVGSGILWMSTYSAALFENAAVRIDNDYADKAADDDCVFVENGVLPLERAKQLIVYRWNRRYPADRVFPAEQFGSVFVLDATADFVGSSHENITEEIYIRR